MWFFQPQSSPGPINQTTNNIVIDDVTDLLTVNNELVNPLAATETDNTVLDNNIISTHVSTPDNQALFTNPVVSYIVSVVSHYWSFISIWKEMQGHVCQLTR